MKLARYLIFFTAVLVSCQGSTIMDKDDYLAFVESEKHGLTVNKLIDEINYSLTLCPAGYIIAREFKVDKISEANYEKREKDLSGFIYFKLKLSKKDKSSEVIMHRAGNEQLVKERLEYFSYGFEENIFVIRNNKRDTLPVTMYHFERTYGVTPNLEFLFSFKSDTSLGGDKNIQVIIDDQVFNNRMVSYEFDKQHYLKAPKLKLY